MAEFIDIFVKFSNLCPGGGAFDSLFVPRGGVLYTMIVREGGRVFAPFESCPGGWFWMKLIPALVSLSKSKIRDYSRWHERQRKAIILFIIHQFENLIYQSIASMTTPRANPPGSFLTGEFPTPRAKRNFKTPTLEPIKTS